MPLSFTLRRSWLAGAALLLGLAACSSEPEKSTIPANRISFNDFEAMDGWVPATPSLTTEKAHSGRYSVKVQPGLDYALGYNNTLGQASSVPLQRLTLKGWLLQTGPRAAAAMVVQIVDAKGQNVFYESMPLVDVVKKGDKWTEFSRDFTLPATLQPEHQLKIYLWKAASEFPAYLDDLEISRQP